MGFYSSGPKIKENDIKVRDNVAIRLFRQKKLTDFPLWIFQISSLIRQFSAHEPVFVIIDVRPGVEGLPTTAYEAVEEVEADGKEIQRVFKHIKCSVEAEEAEEVHYI